MYSNAASRAATSPDPSSRSTLHDNNRQRGAIPLMRGSEISRGGITAVIVIPSGSDDLVFLPAICSPARMPAT